MLLFPPSSIQEPLRDSTNRKCLTHSTGSWKARNPHHLTDLEISDIGSSDTSIYNASTAPSYMSDLTSSSDRDHSSEHSFPAPKHRLQPTHARAKSEGLSQHDMVRFVNRPHGTPLFTIVEQKPLATIRAQLSFASFGKRGPAYLGTTSSGKPKAASVDDTMLFKSRRGSRNTETSSNVDVPSPRNDPVNPLQPPFGPPHRIKTPEGVPQWHANTRVSFLRRMARALRSARSLSLRNGTLFIVRTLRGEIRSRRRVQSQRWRPPVSGHSTYGYTEPTEHPLNNVRSAEVPQAESNIQEEIPALPIPQPTVVERQSLDRRCRSLSLDVSHAQRALGAIDGNAIPINPARALRARSVPVPRKLRAPGTELNMRPSTQSSQSIQDRQPYPSDTMRTTDMIESFPCPPSRSATKARAKLQFFAPTPHRAPSVPFLSTVDITACDPGSPD